MLYSCSKVYSIFFTTKPQRKRLNNPQKGFHYRNSIKNIIFQLNKSKQIEKLHRAPPECNLEDDNAGFFCYWIELIRSLVLDNLSSLLVLIYLLIKILVMILLNFTENIIKTLQIKEVMSFVAIMAVMR